MSIEPGRLGVVALGRPTFDLGLARANVGEAVRELGYIGEDVAWSGEIALDAAAVTSEISAMSDRLDRLVVLQATFSDATMIDAAAGAWAGPMSIWGFPEERTGGRLRLNSFCGMNLAAYRLRSLGRTAGYLYARPSGGRLGALFDERQAPRPSVSTWSGGDGEASRRLRSARIGVVGDPPDGFYPCMGDGREIRDAFGAEIVRIDLGRLFGEAEGAPTEAVESGVRSFAGMEGIDSLARTEVEGSARIGSALDSMRASDRLDALAVRCWPECFTEYGAAACAPIGHLNDRGVPATCEADVYGCLTGLALGAIADGPNVSVDLVDPDVGSDTVVLWHCGHLPPSMASGRVRAIPHPNRGIGVLAEFALRPGRVTIARITRAGGAHAVVVGTGEMLDADRPFSGTCGLMRPDGGARLMIDTVLGHGLDHHLGLVYGDHRDAVASVAGDLELPVIEL